MEENTRGGRGGRTRRHPSLRRLTAPADLDLGADQSSGLGPAHGSGLGAGHGSGLDLDPPDRACGLRLPRGWLFALLVPDQERSPATLLVVRDSAAGVSDALGGVLLDSCAVDGLPTHRCWIYLDSDRHDHRLPRNRLLARLASALGWPRDRSGDWLGPALITGRDLYWADRDIPSVVLAAALPTD